MALPTMPALHLSRQLAMRGPRLPLTRLALTPHRNASSSSKPPKGRLLEKPTRFNPPSHPARLPRRSRPAFQVPLSAKEREQQKTKQYPHMMPPEGTFLHWFLTNRTIHVWITMSILCTLAFATWLNNFLANTPYADQLPPNNMFLTHPLAFLSRYLDVYKLHTEYVSAETAERRRHKVEDVRKRAEYRKAHGLGQEEGVFGGWSARDDGETLGMGAREGGEAQEKVGEKVQELVEKVGGDEYVDFEGRKRPVKKWLGIW